MVLCQNKAGTKQVATIYMNCRDCVWACLWTFPQTSRLSFHLDSLLVSETLQNKVVSDRGGKRHSWITQPNQDNVQ